MHIHTAARSLGSTFLFVEPTLWESESLLQSIQVSMDTSEPGWYPGDGQEHANEENTKELGGCHIISWWGSAAKSSWWIHLMMKKVCMIMCFMVKCSVCQHMDLFKIPFINPCIEYSLLKHWLSRPSHCSLSLHSLFPYTPTAHQSGQGSLHYRAEEKPGVSTNSRLELLSDWPAINYPKRGTEGLKHKANQYCHWKEGCSPIFCAILELQLSKPSCKVYYIVYLKVQ